MPAMASLIALALNSYGHLMPGVEDGANQLLSEIF